MRWIGQHIWDFTSKFRSDVYLESLTDQEEEYTVMVAADGKLTKSTHPGERSRLQVRNDEGSTIPAGAPLYSKGEIGGSERIKVGICDANDTAKMPCIGIAEFEMNTSDTKDSFAVTQGVYNTNISGFTGLSEGDIVYVDDSGSAPYLTQNKSDIAGSGSAIQNVGIVLKTNGTICQGLLVSAIGRSNDVPNLDNNTIFIGNASNQTVALNINSIHGYQYISFVGNIEANTNGNGYWEHPTPNGISNHTWTQIVQTKVDGTDNRDTTTVGDEVGIDRLNQGSAGIRIPYAGTIVGFTGSGRNASGDRAYYGGLFVGTPDWGTTNKIDAELVAVAQADNTPGGTYTSRPAKVEDLSRSYSISAGDVIYPAIKGSGTNADTIQINFTIVIKTSLVT